MLRVTTIFASSAAASARYYAQYLTKAPGEVPGVWTGRQAIGLGLGGEVTVDALQALLEGRDPVSGTPLGRELVDRFKTDGGVVRAVAGFDATFSAPKSVSVLWGLTQDVRFLEAHDAAVTAALANLERYGSTTRVRAGGGRLHPESQGLTMATFRQTTSRADDPQLHTHAVISAKVQTIEGRWLALDARYLKRHQRMLGGLYQSALRSELTHRFGVAWEAIVNGQAEIVGMPAELLEVFSKRTSEVDVELEEKLGEFRDREGRDPSRRERAALTREAAIDTRAPKSGVGVGELVTRWTTEADAIGWTAAELVEVVIAADRELAADPEPVTMADVVEALTVKGSAWNRADVVQAICDITPPVRSMSADRWAAALERACDRVVETCIDLDPDRTGGARRGSDGRSLWLEPTAAHITSDRVLAEEELVLSWAIDAQHDDPQPSTTIDIAGLDVLQADVAAAVAGSDRLVIAVGPAGAGKTTTLRTAVEDLHSHGRAVFGVAPSAKAARVLERETGLVSDTLAKLLHEHHRGDRPPDDRYRLPSGSTVVVDEAGMVGTAALAQLVDLAERHDWRLVLIGDHHQLQAVGRGGLFHELCTNGRTIELTHIHRFTEAWEAAASLQLRHGDSAGLDVYISHGRVIADTFDNHLGHIANRWLDVTAREGVVAITASTNDHVDAINAAVQQARHEAGQLDERVHVAIGGHENARIGDIVVTRRNDRTITTTTGEPVRNREQWTVTDIDSDGAITVTSRSGSGHVTLPAEYVSEHVRLGYAATEHGNQGDTVTIGIELATAATTRRGLYVGVTRGREENLICVVTEHSDLDEACDILEGVLAVDRADIPATTQRQLLADTVQQPDRRPPELQPRCPIPPWFDQLRADLGGEYTEAHTAAVADDQHLADLRGRLTDADAEAAAAARELDRYQPALDAAHRDVTDACDQRRAASERARHAKLGHRRAARTELEQAAQAHAVAIARQAEIDELAAPARARFIEADDRTHSLRSTLSTTVTLHRWSGYGDRAERLQRTFAALDDWRDWADGKPIDPHRLTNAVHTLASHGADYATLAHTVIDWADHFEPDLAVALTPPPTPQPPSLSIELDL